MSGTCSLNRPVTCAGSEGAAMVTTAFASGQCCAVASTAAPPRLWPIRSAGARYVSRKCFAAATRSATFDEKLVLANSPSLAPSPVKSKRSTAMPRAVNPSAMRFAASTSLPQVKQCANSAYAAGWPAGLSMSAESFSPCALGKSKRSDGISSSGGRVILAQIAHDRSENIGVIVGPDALFRIELDRLPILVVEQFTEILLLARADDRGRGKDVIGILLVVPRRTIVHA